MLTTATPSDIVLEDRPRIETVYSEKNYYGASYNEPSVYYLSSNEIQITDDLISFNNKEQPIFQEYFHVKVIETLYNSIKNEQKRFQEEQVELPNQLVIDRTFDILSTLSNQNIYPTLITPTIEEGMCLAFIKAQFRLYFELYNSGEVGYIIEDAVLKKIVKNEDLESIKEITSIIEKFFQ